MSNAAASPVEAGDEVVEVAVKDGMVCVSSGSAIRYLCLSIYNDVRTIDLQTPEARGDGKWAVRTNEQTIWAFPDEAAARKLLQQIRVAITPKDDDDPEFDTRPRRRRNTEERSFIGNVLVPAVTVFVVVVGLSLPVASVVRFGWGLGEHMLQRVFPQTMPVLPMLPPLPLPDDDMPGGPSPKKADPASVRM